MSERRYTDEEVAEIFQRATEAQSPEMRRLASHDGMTLAQLQEIGREVGVAPELVARAALSVDQSAPASERRLLGFPIGVGRTVELGRRLSDDEWERLVVDLRETFDAKGKVTSDGALRQWTNSNLHAYIEPGADGHRLRMRTLNGRSRLLMVMGAGYTGFAGILAATLGATHSLSTGRLPGIEILAAVGVGLFTVGAARLPDWARRRRKQMADIAERLLAHKRSADE